MNPAWPLGEPQVGPALSPARCHDDRRCGNTKTGQVLDLGMLVQLALV